MKKQESTPHKEGPAPQVENFLRRSDVCKLTGMGVSTLYEHMKVGKFPRPIALSPRLVVWREIDIANWQASRIAAHKSK